MQNQEFIKQVEEWIKQSRDHILPVNQTCYDLCTGDFLRLMAKYPQNTSILYSYLQNAVERYKSENLALVPPLFFKVPGESWPDYLKRCYEANYIPF